LKIEYTLYAQNQSNYKWLLERNIFRNYFHYQKSCLIAMELSNESFLFVLSHANNDKIFLSKIYDVITDRSKILHKTLAYKIFFFSKLIGDDKHNFNIDENFGLCKSIF